MKIRTALIIAVILGLFTYTLPLYAGSPKEYHLEEKTVVEIPVVGKITTYTDSYLSGCKLKEQTTFKMHNSLIKMMSSSDGKSHNIQLSDMCEEVQWTYDSDDKLYRSKPFSELRENTDDPEPQIDMELDQNDIDDIPRMTHEIMGYEKNINGFKAQKVISTIHPDDAANPIIIEEYYTSKAKALTKINNAREDLRENLGHDKDNIEGVPSMVEVFYEAMRKDHEWDRPDGEVVRFIIKMLDNEDDLIFSMTYDVTTAEILDYHEDHFSLK